MIRWEFRLFEADVFDEEDYPWEFSPLYELEYLEHYYITSYAFRYEISKVKIKAVK